MKRHEVEIVGRKVNIGTTARKILNEDTPLQSLQDPLDENFLDQPSAESVWLSHTQEGYALAGILTHEVIENARSQRPSFPPYGLPHASHPQKPEALQSTQEVEHLHELSDAFLISLRISKESVFKKLEDQSKTNPNMLSTIYTRYQKIHGFSKRYFDKPKIDITSGIRTAIIRMENTTENIIILLMKMKGENATIHDFETVAKNSWPYIAENASSHLHTLRSSRIISMHPKSHMLSESTNGLMLSYTNQAKEDIAKSATFSPVESSELRPTYGCVGLINFNGGNAVHNLWNWYVDAVKMLHETNYQGESISNIFGAPSSYANI